VLLFADTTELDVDSQVN